MYFSSSFWDLLELYVHCTINLLLKPLGWTSGTGGVVALDASILHRFVSSHAIIRAFYVHLFNHASKLITVNEKLKNLKLATGKFNEACTTMCLNTYIDYYSKKR